MAMDEFRSGCNTSEVTLRGRHWVWQKRHFVALMILLSLGLADLALTQSQPGSAPAGTVMSGVLNQVMALGPRAQSKGMETTILVGQLLDGAGNRRPIRIEYERSGMVRIDGVREGTVLRFDGRFSRGWSDRIDESLLETFVMDTTEGMLTSLQQGAALHLLGRGFRPDPRVVPDYKGPKYDIFEVTGPVRSRDDKQLRRKRYYFDFESGLLLSARYTDPTVSSGLSVETRFSSWQQLHGSAYPTVIERLENGTVVFSLIISEASAAPGLGPERYR